MRTDQEIMDQWPDSCHICGAEMGRDRYLHRSIVELKAEPKNAEPFYTKLYVICSKCNEEKEIV